MLLPISNQYTLVNLDDFKTPRPPPPNSRLLYQNSQLLRIILKALCFVIFFSIKDGATLQLVLAMRGGPINMKRGVKYFHGYQLLSINLHPFSSCKYLIHIRPRISLKSIDGNGIKNCRRTYVIAVYGNFGSFHGIFSN